MIWELFLSFKFLTAKKKHALISVISLISVAGITIGVAALIVVLAVMSGFDNELKEKIIGFNSEILVEKEAGISDYVSLSEELVRVNGIESVAPFVNAQALLVNNAKTAGVIIRGIDIDVEKNTTSLKKYITKGEFRLSEGEVIMGSELAKKFGANISSTISLVSPVTNKSYDFKIAAFFNSGMYDYDANIVFINIPDARRILNLGDLVGGFEIKIKDRFSPEEVKNNIAAILGYDYTIRTWMESNKSFFSALKLEKLTMFVILTLIVIVAALNIATSLIMTVMEKTKDIGILRAIGATKRSIMAIFALNGTLIGLGGTGLGVGLGILLANVLKKYQFVDIPKDIYYIDKIPVLIIQSDVLAIAISSIVITFLATIYPAYKAASLNITDALRYE